MLTKEQLLKINTLLQKQVVQKFGVLAVALLVISSVSYFGYKQNQSSHAAGVGVLSMSPASGNVVVGSNVSVTLYEDSGTDPVNAVQASITYDATKMQYMSIAEGTAFPTVAATSTSTPGILRLARGTVAGDDVTGNKAIATVTFKVLGSSGTTGLNYDPSFSAIVRSTDNANILTTNPGANFTLKLPLPTVSAISQASGSTRGGTAVTITGTNFVSGATVAFDTVQATNVTYVNPTTITAVTPEHSAGLSSVSVTNPDGQTNGIKQAFTFVAPAPLVRSIAPAFGSGTGGTTVSITGVNLTAVSGITFGGAAATSVTLVSPTQITAVTPSHAAGTVGIVVVFSDQTAAVTLSDAFTYTVPAPTVSSVSFNSGTTAGGASLTLTGTNFVNVTGVTVGGTAATNVATANSTALTFVTPAHAAGTVSIVVTTATGSATLTNAFTYKAPSPTISGISPDAGTSNGGTVVTITGTNFVSGATVSFGTTTAKNITFVSATTLRATAPAGTATSTAVPAANITVTNPDTQKVTLPAAYKYLALGDANSDGRVNAIDLSILISHDGQNYAAADFNGDGIVGSADLAILLGRWTW